MTFQSSFPSSIARIGSPTFTYGDNTMGQVMITREIDGTLRTTAVSFSMLVEVAQTFSNEGENYQEHTQLNFSGLNNPEGFPVAAKEVVTFVAAYTRHCAVAAAKLTLDYLKESSDSALMDSFPKGKLIDFLYDHQRPQRLTLTKA